VKNFWRLKGLLREDDVEIFKKKYTLQCVFVHEGLTPDLGHFYTVVRKPDELSENNWLKVDAKSVVKVRGDVEKDVEKKACVLLYRKASFHEPEPERDDAEHLGYEDNFDSDEGDADTGDEQLGFDNSYDSEIGEGDEVGEDADE
jgi:hypothetical protein